MSYFTEDKKTPRTDDEITARVNGRWMTGHEAKSLPNQYMRLAIAMYLGEQYAYIDKINSTFNYPTEEKKRQVEGTNYFLGILNLIKPASKWVISQITSRQQSMYMNPKTRGDHAKDVASAGTDLLNYHRFHKDYLSIDLEVATWMVICGKGYKRVRPKVTAVAAEKIEGRDMAVGSEVEIDAVSPLEFVGTPGVKKIDDMPWLIIAKHVDRSIPEAMYGIDLTGKEEETQTYELKPTVGMFSAETRTNQVLVKEYYEKPSNDNPRGSHFVIVGDQVINPKKDREFPHWKITFDQVTGQEIETPDGYRIVDYTYDDSLLSHWAHGLPDPNVIYLQKMINILHSSWYSNRIITLGVKLEVDDRQTLSEDESSNLPGTVRNLEHQGFPKPTYRVAPAMPADTAAHMAFLKQSFGEATGVPGLVQGKEPMKRMAALAIQYLTEQTQIMFRPMFDRYDDKERHTAANLIATYRQFSKEKVSKILGKERQREADALMKDDPDDYDIMYERGSSMPESKAGQIGTIIEVMQYSKPDMTNPSVMAGFMEALNTGWSKGMVAYLTDPKEMAEEENRRLLAGEYVPVPKFQNHDIHMSTHQSLFDSPEYMNWAGTPIEQKVLDHMEGVHGRPVMNSYGEPEINRETGEPVTENRKGHVDYLAPPMPPEGLPPEGAPPAAELATPGQEQPGPMM